MMAGCSLNAEGLYANFGRDFDPVPADAGGAGMDAAQQADSGGVGGVDGSLNDDAGVLGGVDGSLDGSFDGSRDGDADGSRDGDGGAVLGDGASYDADSAVRDANVDAPTSGNPMVRKAFFYTGANQSYVVPAGVTSLTVHGWGAGGCAMKYTRNMPTTFGNGGGGGYARVTLPVTPGETLSILVGGGGVAGPIGVGSTAGGFGGGGSGYVTQDGGWGQCSGGGRTALRRGTTELFTAGGGGGGGGADDSVRGKFLMHGGGGGGLVGQSADSPATAATGGTQSTGGVRGWGGCNGGSNGSQFQGGNATSSWAAGGGGGYFGGGAGGGPCGCLGPGGGGSSYVNAAGATQGVTMGAVGLTPGGVTHALYPGNGVGYGGLSRPTGSNGGDGYLVLE